MSSKIIDNEQPEEKIRNLRWLLFYFLSLSMAGCAYPISEEVREEVTEDVSFQMVLKNPSAYVGDIVLWGGSIIRTENLKEEDR